MLTKAKWAFAIVAFIAVVASGFKTDSAFAQQLSDRSVKVLMNYAWLTLPTKFTTQTGKVIKVDKSKKAEVIVPVDLARHIIKVGRLSAHAQICNLPKAQTLNYRAMMRVELLKKQWSEQQLLYISQLHLFTILWLTGNVQVTQEENGKTVSLNEGADRKQPTCTDAERDKVQKRIDGYVKSVIGKS